MIGGPRSGCLGPPIVLLAPLGGLGQGAASGLLCRGAVVAAKNLAGGLRAATDERDLHAMRSLRLEQLKGNRAGTSSIRLNDQFRLIIRFKTNDEGRMVIVIEMVDYH